MKNEWVVVCALAGVLVLPGTDVLAQQRVPNPQPATAEAPTGPTGEVALGTVRLPRGVTADGKPLPAGTYQVRLTAEEVKPQVVGISEHLQRWAEFVQNGKVRGREVVNIVPQGEIKMVVQDAPPAANSSKVQVLRGNEYLRVWINRSGTHYLMHFPIGGGSAGAD